MDLKTTFVRSKQKIGLVNCDDQEKWGGEIGSCKLLIEIYAHHASLPTDMFVPIHTITGKLPTLQDLPDYAGFIIAGSHYSVNDTSEWMLKLEKFVRMCKNFYEKTESNGKATNAPRIIGVCFCHQIGCKALGGTVGKNPSGKFVFGTEIIEPTTIFRQRAFTRPLCKSGTTTFNVLQTHCDSILTLPEGAEVLAKSASCAFEMVQYGNGIVGIQGHPDLTAELMMQKILPSLQEKNVLTEEETKKALFSVESITHSKEIVDALLCFMYNGVGMIEERKEPSPMI